jgi:hypothetical protein
MRAWCHNLTFSLLRQCGIEDACGGANDGRAAGAAIQAPLIAPYRRKRR